MLKKFTIIAQELLFPSHCYLCEGASLFHFPLCRPCLKSLEPIRHFCQQCGLTLCNDALCGQCLNTPPPFDKTLPCYAYAEKTKALLQLLKFGHKLYLSPLVAKLMARVVKNHYPLASRPSLLLPMPLHPQKLKQRGFNPSVEITRHLSRYLNIPFDINTAKRIRSTAPQASLKLKERAKNVNNAFASQAVNHAHLAIVDDVMTSGATTASLAKVLKKNGATRVDVWCFARTQITR